MALLMMQLPLGVYGASGFVSCVLGLCVWFIVSFSIDMNKFEGTVVFKRTYN